MTLAACLDASRPEGVLIGAWFDGQAHDRAGLPTALAALPPAELAEVAGRAPVLTQAAAWLDAYFSGKRLGPRPALAPAGTDFQRLVWPLLTEVPLGGTTTYGELARQVAERRGRVTSPRAVGAAVGRNPISVIVPCHRVLGSGRELTGYAGGLERKRWLLTHEGVTLS